MIHGVNTPWKLPSYRFSGLVIAYLKDDKVPESVEKIDAALSESDGLVHPFRSSMFRGVVKAVCEKTSSRSVVDNVVYDSRLTDLPVEERKRQEARAAGKPFRVPEWWRGEKANYKVASSMMKTLPKKIGPMKDK